MNLTVIDDKIIVRPIKVEAEEKRASGLIVPKNVAKAIQEDDLPQGEVVYIGDGTKDIPMKIRVGKIISYNEHAGLMVKDDKENKYLIMRQADIVCIHN